MRNLLEALQHINRAYDAIDSAKKSKCICSPFKKDGDAICRCAQYEYADDINFHKVKLVNIKKSILSITGNRRLPELYDDAA